MYDFSQYIIVCCTIYTHLLAISQHYGEFEITVSRGEWRGKECYMIHVTEETIVQDVPKVINIIGKYKMILQLWYRLLHTL